MSARDRAPWAALALVLGAAAIVGARSAIGDVREVRDGLRQLIGQAEALGMVQPLPDREPSRVNWPPADGDLIRRTTQ